MQKLQSQQLTFDFFERKPTGLFEATRPLQKHRYCNQVLKRLSYVRRFFPELGERKIRVGLTRVASGMAVPGGHEIWFNPSQISYHAIAHEFVHLLQGSHGIPTGERSCDLFSLARHWTLNDTAPYYVRVPRHFLDSKGNITPAYARLICSVARGAIEMKHGGLRNYIAYFEKTLRGESASRHPTLTRA
jgi:hypothetical protein